MQQIIDRYGLVLFKLVPDESILKKVNEDAAKITNLFDEQPSIFSFLTSRVTKIKDAQLALTIIAQEFNIHKLTFRFLNVLITNRRLKLLSKIIAQFNDLVAQKNGVSKVQIVSAYPLKVQAKDQIEEQLANQFDKQFIYDYYVDPQLLGGTIIKIGSMTLDCSLKSKLLQLQQHLAKS